MAGAELTSTYFDAINRGSMGRLGDIFRAHLGVPALASDLIAGLSEHALEEMLHDVVQAGTKTWPTVHLAAADFVRHLAERLEPAPSLERTLQRTCLGDLFLACACLRADTQALLVFDQRFLGAARRYLAATVPDAVIIDEIIQALRVKLLLNTPTGAGRIAAYSGRGPLRYWLKSVATRAAIDRLRTVKTSEDIDACEPIVTAMSATPELAYLKDHFHDLFRTSLLEAFAKLEPKQRTLLSLSYVERMGIDAISAICNVHRATAARWIEGSRAAIFDETKRLVQHRANVTASDFASLVKNHVYRDDRRSQRSARDRPGAKRAHFAINRQPRCDKRSRLPSLHHGAR